MDDKATEAFMETTYNDAKHKTSGRQHGITPFLLLAITVTTLGCSLPTGHNLGVINTPQEIMRAWVQEAIMERYNVRLTLSQDLIVWSVIVSIFVGGAAIGSVMGAPLADATGRCRAILLVNVLNLLASIMFICCKMLGSVEMLILGRLIGGITAGLSTSLVPLYLSEVAPTALKGVMGVLLPFGLCAGLLASQIMGMDTVMGTHTLWPFLVGGFGIYVIASLILYPTLPESPVYCFLILRDDIRGRKELQRLRVGYSNLTEEEMLIKGTAPLLPKDEINESTKQWNMKQVFASKELRFPLLLVVMLNVTQQLSGINAVFYYSTIIFRGSGLTMAESQIAAICAGIINWLMSATAIPLIRYCSRRHLLLWSIALSIVCQLTLMLALYLIPTIQEAGFVAIFALLAYVLAYGAGLGPVPYMIATELFPLGPRPVGLAMGGAANWGSNLLVGLAFPSLQQAAGEYSFCVFIIICSLAGAFFYRYLPETSSKEVSSPSVSDNVSSSLSTISSKEPTSV